MIPSTFAAAKKSYHQSHNFNCVRRHSGSVPRYRKEASGFGVVSCRNITLLVSRSRNKLLQGKYFLVIGTPEFIPPNTPAIAIGFRSHKLL
jgi:hypothetical protein